MIFLLGIIFAQATNTDHPKIGLQVTGKGVEHIMNQSFDCMDSQVKLQLQKHPVDATPEIIVSAAWASCASLQNLYSEEIEKYNPLIPREKSIKISEEWFSSLKQTYIENTHNFFSKQEVAEVRVKMAIGSLQECVTAKSTAWSRLRDDAATIAQAAITECYGDKQNVVAAVGYQLRSKSLPASNAEVVTSKLEGTMRDVAIAKIISERAKSLPARR